MSRGTVNRKREIENTTGNLHKKRPAFRSFFYPYSVQLRDNTDQKNSKYRHFSGSTNLIKNMIVKISFQRPGLKLNKTYNNEFFTE